MTAIIRGDVWWVSLDPTRGSEIRKTRPCLVLTNNTLNLHRRTVIVVPYSTSAQAYPPITVPVSCHGRSAVAIIDQARAVDKSRLHDRIESASAEDLARVTRALQAILELP